MNDSCGAFSVKHSAIVRSVRLYAMTQGRQNRDCRVTSHITLLLNMTQNTTRNPSYFLYIRRTLSLTIAAGW